MPEPTSDAAAIFGGRVRKARRDLGLSQEDAANLAGMNVSNFGKIERGISNPRFHTIVGIAVVLGVDPGTLLEGIARNHLPATRSVFTAAEFIRERKARS